MATVKELQETFELIVGAGLNFAPRSEEDITARAKAWRAFLEDIPGELLLQAVKDIVISGKDFPTIKQVRDAAYQVKVHNGVSAAPNPFKPIQAGRQALSIYPPDVLKVIEEFERKYDINNPDLEAACALPTDEEFKYLDELTRPYRERVNA
jgi:hypothetical protein